MDDLTRTLRAVAKPDPRRYESRRREDGLYYRDKYLDVLISEQTLKASLVGLPGAPIYVDPPTIGNTIEYAADRRSAIADQLQSGAFIAPKSKADQHHQLTNIEPNKDITFLSVDICGSTKLRAKDSRSYDRAYAIFFQELGAVVGQFHGTILAPTGDGFIAYIDSPSINVQSDNAVDMGLSFIAVLEQAVNPALKSEGLPTLSIRVGADHGLAIVSELKVPATGFSEKTVKSDALNRCAKIQSKAKPSQLLIGRELYERIHVQWLERCREESVDLAETLGFEKYPIYSVT
jgi:class 3 adenylate cyclase